MTSRSKRKKTVSGQEIILRIRELDHIRKMALAKPPLTNDDFQRIEKAVADALEVFNQLGVDIGWQ